MNILVKLIVYLIIEIKICESIESYSTESSINTICETERGDSGVCLVKELCPQFDANPSHFCSDGQTVCCLKSNPKKLNQFWTPINNFWNNFNNFSSSQINRPPTPSPSSSSEFIAVCGSRRLKSNYGFIVGGSIAPPHSWPWAVAVYTGSGYSLHNYKFVCGASVIAPQYVLGAAHCVSHNNRVTRPENIRLLIGAHDRRYEGIYYRVEKVVVHSKYDERLMQNDITLYKLVEKIDFKKTSITIAPVCLPSPAMDSRDLSQQLAYLVGWGTTSAGGPTSDYLRQVQVPIIANRECVKSYNSLMITSNQLCAGYTTGQRDSCQGDSGGPMTVPMNERQDQFLQIGIVSWGKGCAEPSNTLHHLIHSFEDFRNEFRNYPKIIETNS